MKQPDQHKDGGCGQNEFRCQLCVSQTVQRKQPVQDIESRYLQNDFAQHGENQGMFPETAGLEYANGQEIHTQEGNAQAHAPQKFCPTITGFFIKAVVSAPAPR